MSLLTNLKVLENLRIDGSIDVQGNTSSGNTANITVADANVFLNKNYLFNAPERGGGFAVNTEALSTFTISGIASGVISTSAPHGLAVGDIVQLSGLNLPEDEGVYVVDTVPLITTFTVGLNLNDPFDFKVVRTSTPANQGTGGNATKIVLTIWSQGPTGDVTTTFGSSSTEIDANKGVIGEERPLLENITVVDELYVGPEVTTVPRTYYIKSTSPTAPVDIFLPDLSSPASASWEGQRITIVRDSTSIAPGEDVVRINPEGPPLIENQSVITLELTPYEKVTLVANTTRLTGGPSDGPTWVIE